MNAKEIAEKTVAYFNKDYPIFSERERDLFTVVKAYLDLQALLKVAMKELEKVADPEDWFDHLDDAAMSAKETLSTLRKK